MVPDKQQHLLSRINKVCGELMLLGTDFAMNMDKKDCKLPSDTLEGPLIEFLGAVLILYKHDHKGLYSNYRSSDLWKKAIRTAFGMDDEDEGGFWFYHIYGIAPNPFFAIYLEDHPSIAFEKILEMFEHNLGEEFLALDLPVKEILSEEMLDYAIKEILNIIDERVDDNVPLNRKKVAEFLAWMYRLDVKKMESLLQYYETEDPTKPFQEIAESCRYHLQHSAKEQTSFNFTYY